MSRTLNKDTQLCMSLSGRPGNTGTRFHNFLYEELGLNFVYKAFTTTDLPAAIGGIRALGIRGCAISMPFKEACIPLVDELEESAKAIQSINTIVNEGGRLHAYNTDYIAISSLLKTHGIPDGVTFALQGSGGMAKAVASALRDAGFRNGAIVARNASAGQALAQACGFEWRSDMEGLAPQMLINVTPIGMADGPESEQLAFRPEVIDRASIVFDVVAHPPETPLVRYARATGKHVVTGAEVLTLQAVEQFVLYTGVRPNSEQIKRAAEFAAQRS